MCLCFTKTEGDKWDGKGDTKILWPLNVDFIFAGSLVIQQLQQSAPALLVLHSSQFTLSPRLNQKSVERLQLVQSPAAAETSPVLASFYSELGTFRI